MNGSSPDHRKHVADLKLARDIQQGLLPDGNPRIEGFDVAGWNRPATEIIHALHRAVEDFAGDVPQSDA